MDLAVPTLYTRPCLYGRDHEVQTLEGHLRNYHTGVFTHALRHTHTDTHTHTHLHTRTNKIVHNACARPYYLPITHQIASCSRRLIVRVFMQKDNAVMPQLRCAHTWAQVIMLHKGMVHYPAADDTGATRALYPGALSTRHSLLGVNTQMLVPLSYHPSISSYSSSSSPMFCAAVALSLCSAGVIQTRRGSYK